jgi:hypothetical protein
MGLMSDIFKRGYNFASATGEKTGANHEDLVTRAVLVAGSQLVDQVTIEDYADAAITDDDGAALRRLRMKDGGISAAKLAVGADWGGDEQLLTVFGSAAAAAAAMGTLVVSGVHSLAPASVANIFDRNIATYWVENAVSAGTVFYYWDLGAVYKGNLFLYGDVRTTGQAYLFPHATVAVPDAVSVRGLLTGIMSESATGYTGSFIKPFYGRYIGIGLYSTTMGYSQVRRFEAYAKAV